MHADRPSSPLQLADGVSTGHQGQQSATRESNTRPSDCAERPSNFYDSAYLAEYYDCFIEENIESLDTHCDVPIYWEAFQKVYSARQPPPSTDERFVVLDIGTGTGRCLHDLAASASSAHVDLADTHFIGLDNTPAMLTRASQMSKMSHVGAVSWELGSALDLLSVRSLKKADLVLFAVGSISHLTGEDEPRRFFAQLSQVLRPGSGRAYIPLQDDLISTRYCTTAPVAKVATWAQVVGVQEFKSKLYDGVWYRQTPPESSVRVGHVQNDKYRLLAIKKGKDGQETVLENNFIDLKLRLFDEKEWMELIQGAGLALEKTFHSAHETYYVIKLAG